MLLLASELTGEHLGRKIQADAERVPNLQLLDNRQRMLVVGKAMFVSQASMERRFASVSERWVPDIVEQGKGLDEIFVQPQGPPHRAGDRGDLLGVGETSTVVVAHLACENLHFAAEPPVGAAMDNAVTIPLIGSTVGMFWFRKASSGRRAAGNGIRCQERGFAFCNRH